MLAPGCSSDRQDFRECLVCLPKKRRLVCLSEKWQYFVCLSRPFAKTSTSLGTKRQTAWYARKIVLTRCVTVYIPYTVPCSYQLRRSCCASAGPYRVIGLSFPTELPVMEKVLLFADSVAGIAKSAKARCRKSGYTVPAAKTSTVLVSAPPAYKAVGHLSSRLLEAGCCTRRISTRT
jgi:hypothetical protein